MKIGCNSGMHLAISGRSRKENGTAGRERRLIYFTSRPRAKTDFRQSAESEVTPIAAACVAMQKTGVLLISA